MKKKLTNGEIYNIGITIFGENGVAKRRDLKTTIAMRHMFKVNASVIEEKALIVQDEINETVKELILEFKDNQKTREENGDILIKESFVAEFDFEQQSRINEVANQTIEVDLHIVSENDVNKYFEINDGKLTSFEMDILEMFVGAKESL